VNDRLQTAMTPLAQLQSRRDALVSRLAGLDHVIDSVRDQLNKHLISHARVVKPTFSGLAENLHEVLDEVILSADLMSTKEANRVDVQKTLAIQDWIAKQGGPVSTWEREKAAFINRTRLAVGEELRKSYPSEYFDVIQQKIDINLLDVPDSPRHKSGTQDIVQRAAVVVGTVTPITAGVAAAIGIVTGPLLLVPAGIAVGAGLLYATLRHQRRRSSSMDLLRAEWISDLDKAAAEYTKLFETAIAATGGVIVDRAEAILRERSSELANEILHIERSIDEPENVDRKDLVNTLEPHVERGRALVVALDELRGLGR
jgi:ElaB/YqjD/DUF883 family membrane-anchored ribosome-binding protein